MALDPNRWTLKTQEALQEASRLAEAAHNPEVAPGAPPARRCSARTAASPSRSSIASGIAPLAVRNRLAEVLAKVPQRLRRRRAAARRARLVEAFERAADGRSKEMGDEYLSVEHLLLALADRARRRAGRSSSRRCARCAAATASPRRTPRRVPGAGEVRPRPHRARPPRQARPGHRPRRRDPPRHPGALAAHEEQPRADRRARRRQDRHRRGPRRPHRRGRRARGAAQQAHHRASTCRRWSPAPSTAASSRSG